MKIDGRTEIYGIIGRPVAHSLSPAMHNAAFAALGLNKVYLAFEVDDVAGALTGLRALGIRGASVTIPHKESVLPYLDEVDPIATKIGAINTLICTEGRLRGLNTDWLGANRALAEKMPLAGSRVLILGAGGSARAIGFGLLEAGAEITIASRTPEKGQALAKVLDCPWLPLAEASGHRADALVNATSVGMSPLTEAIPIDPNALTHFGVVMDIVYSPLTTSLLQEAHAAGCQVINGLVMLLYQGAAQFELWTARSAPLEVMREALLAGMQK